MSDARAFPGRPGRPAKYALDDRHNTLICLLLHIIVSFYFSYSLRLSSDLLPSREAVDDRFQHTLDVLTVTTMGQLNAQAQELSIDMLNYPYCYLIKILLLI